MRTRNLLLMALVCAVAILTSDVGAQPDGPKKKLIGDPASPWAPMKGAAPARVRWEYRAMTYHQLVVMEKDSTFEANLNRLGAEGWELVAIDSHSGAKPARDSMYVFRRPATGKPAADTKQAVDSGPKTKEEPRSELRIYQLK